MNNNKTICVRNYFTNFTFNYKEKEKGIIQMEAYCIQLN